MKIKLLSSLLIGIVAITACKKSGQNPDPGNTGTTGEMDTYICGNLFLTPSVPQATYWKNGLQTTLNNDFSDVCCMTSQAKDVYILGEDHNGECYWKNGIRFQVENKKTSYIPFAIAVQGNDVYTAGHFSDTAAYCKNGITTKLSSPGYSVATGIAVSGSDVYVCGDYAASPGFYHVPCYWKNGVLTLLNKDIPKNATAIAIVVNGGDIHVIVNAALTDQSNQQLDHIFYWKNGVVTPIDKDVSSSATGLCVSGNDVYISGGENIAPFKAGYWKNGTFVSFPDMRYSLAIAVHGNDVYIAGAYLSGGVSYAGYWKNGTITKLNQTLSSYALGITLVPR
ncbi:MAG: hypothetical protein JWR50_4127 [Mucilaginibacter sp.]|nr:hypothetical protein [Mucilaginibacter sp.]